MTRFLIASWALVCGCASAGTGTAASSDGRSDSFGSQRSLAEDVVLVGGFGHVAALAVSRARVFVVADGGVAMYDRLASRWLVLFPLPVASELRPRAALAVADPLGDALWVTLGARLWLVRPSTRFFSAVTLPGEARELLLDRLGRGAYVLSNGWWLVSPTGGASPLPPGQTPPRDEVIASADARQILRDTPGLEGFLPLLTRDAQLHTWPLTALARAPDRNEIWAGTDGGGAFVVDPTFLRSTQMPYGLRARGASALAPAADGVWIAEEPDAFSAGDMTLTFATEDLASWRWLSPARGAPVVVAMAVRGQDACLATTGSVLITNLESRDLVTPKAFDFAQLGRLTSAWGTPHGCWVGGTAGFARVPWPGDSASRPVVITNGQGVFAFASSGDTLWAATQTGVRAYLSTADGSLAAWDNPASTLPNALGGPIRAIALAGTGLALLTDRELWLTEGDRRLTSARRVEGPIEQLGRTRRIAADDRTLWIAGSRGAAAFSLVDHRWRSVTAPVIPGAVGFDTDRERDVRDVALSPRVAWFATGAGILRVARGPDGMPR